MCWGLEPALLMRLRCTDQEAGASAMALRWCRCVQSTSSERFYVITRRVKTSPDQTKGRQQASTTRKQKLKKKKKKGSESKRLIALKCDQSTEIRAQSVNHFHMNSVHVSGQQRQQKGYADSPQRKRKLVRSEGD